MHPQLPSQPESAKPTNRPKPAPKPKPKPEGHGGAVHITEGA